MSDAAAPTAAPGRRALAHIDKVLAERPGKNGHELSAALRCLGELRDGVVAERRNDPEHSASASLEHLNAVISCVLATQFPLGEVPWQELVKARDWLAAVVEERQPR